jgi:flagellar basal-body rod protein FlgF
MAGSYYIALSGMQARMDALDRLASDIANVNTAGYKSERATTAEAERADFGASLQAAIDVADGPSRIDLRAGAITATGRDLDAAIEGPGMFTVSTPGGTRYTRDGRFVRRADGVLSTSTGDPVTGADGSTITISPGPVEISADGSVRAGGVTAGRLQIVEFSDPAALVRDGVSLLRSTGEVPRPAAQSEVKSGALEQSNVSVPDRIVELASVSRNFETMQRALSMLSNDIDQRAITELGRRQ